MPTHGNSPEGFVCTSASNAAVPQRKETDVQREVHSVSPPDGSPVNPGAAECGMGTESTAVGSRHIQFAPLPQLPPTSLSSPLPLPATLVSGLSGSPCSIVCSSFSAKAKKKHHNQLYQESPQASLPRLHSVLLCSCHHSSNHCPLPQQLVLCRT